MARGSRECVQVHPPGAADGEVSVALDDSTELYEHADVAAVDGDLAEVTVQ